MPRSTAATARRSPSQLLVLCCVLVAVSFVGMASTLVSVLGTNHVHLKVQVNENIGRQPQVDSATLVFEDFRRTVHHDALPALPSHEHVQASWQRHRHEADDASVQSLDAAASNGSLAADAPASAVAAVVLMAGAAEGLAVPGPIGAMTWALSRTLLSRGCVPDPLERPPKA